MFSDPKKNIEQIGIKSGMIIADIGSGSGFYTIESAKALLSTGKVYSIDVNKDLLVRIKNMADKENLSNVEIIWGNAEKIGGTNIKDSSVDLCLLCNVLFQIDDKKSLFSEIKRILVPGGKLALIDWSDSFAGLGPKSDRVVNESSALEIIEKNGFAKERSIKAGSHHYGMICKKI